MFLPGECQGQGRIESDTTEVTSQQLQQQLHLWPYFSILSVYCDHLPEIIYPSVLLCGCHPYGENKVQRELRIAGEI